MRLRPRSVGDHAGGCQPPSQTLQSLRPGRVQGRIVAALDGIEVLSSYSRSCDSCLQRRVLVKNQAGRKVEQIQYYHRRRGLSDHFQSRQTFSRHGVAAAGRKRRHRCLALARKLPDMYGSPFFDILLLDALYAQTPASSWRARSAGIWSSASKETCRSCISRRFACCAAPSRFLLCGSTRRQELSDQALGYRRTSLLD